MLPRKKRYGPAVFHAFAFLNDDVQEYRAKLKEIEKRNRTIEKITESLETSQVSHLSMIQDHCHSHMQT